MLKVFDHLLTYSVTKYAYKIKYTKKMFIIRVRNISFGLTYQYKISSQMIKI